jgi:hypothetical protein
VAAVGLLAAGLLVILVVAALAWRRTSVSRRSIVDNGVSEQQARDNAAPLTRAILSASRTRSATRDNER